MIYKIYVPSIDTSCPDYLFVMNVLSSAGVRIVDMEACDLCLFTAGTYLSKHNAKAIENEIRTAMGLGKRIVVVKPYGTAYMPLYFRKLKLVGIECLKSQILEIVSDIPIDQSEILFSRYR